MEDYNKVSFRDMVSAKIQKKDSERGDIQGTGFPIHGGKPIKELYRTVYTGGPGCPGEQYMKEPVMEIHHTTTNDDGVSQKTLKSSEAEAEHSEKSIRDMVADRNATGFVKTNGVGMGDVRHDMAEKLADQAIWNKEPHDELDEASEDAWKQAMGDTGNDGAPHVIDEETGYIESIPEPNNPHMTDEFLRQQPAPHSEPVAHNGQGMGDVRHDMATGLVLDKIGNPTKGTLDEVRGLEDAADDAWAQRSGKP